jgi:transposase
VNERQLDKNAARRLAIIRHAREVTGNVALTCRYYGISRQVFYVWYRRYEAEGPAGLRDRSTRPAHCPHETPAEVVEKIIYLRQNYHFGPAKISMYLKRYHDIEISNSGVWRILKRLDLNRLPASQRYKRHDRKWKRYEKPMPGHAVQVDVKFIAPLSSSSREEVLPVHRHRRLHQAAGAADLRQEQPEDRDPVRRLPAGQVSVPDRGDPDRQRIRIPVGVPLAPARPRHPPHLHQARHPPAERQGGTIPVRHEARCRIPGRAGGNSEGGSWV